MAWKLPEPLQINDWKSLNEGETIRVHCDHWKCEDKHDAFTITKIAGGCVYNCYRCGTSGVISGKSNPKEALERVKLLRSKRHSADWNVSDRARPILPADFIPLVTYDKAIPPQAYAWFYKYELDDEDFDAYYIGYSSKMERAIIPVYSGTKLIAWQGRDVFYNRNISLYNKKILKEKPLKYYTEYNKLFNNNNKLYFKIINNNNNIILVEDMISAIKVYNHYGYDIVGIMNSTLHNGLIDDINLRNYNKVFIWLDPDAHIKSVQGALRWKSLGINAKAIRTITDPKEVPYSKMPDLEGIC